MIETIAPEGWRTIKIKDCCENLDNKRVPLNSEDRKKIQGDIPYYGANGVMDHINKWIFDEDLILLAEDGGHFLEYQHRSIAYRITGKSWVNNHAHILRVKKGFDFNFIFYSLVHKNIVPYISGGTRGKLNKSELMEIPLVCPVYDKQVKIGKLLETTNEAIKETDNIIKESEKIKKGLMQSVLINGIDHKNFQETDIGKIPKGWAVSTLGKLGKFLKGKGIAKNEVQETGLPCIRYGEIYTDHHYKIKKFRSFINKESADNSAKLEQGDLLFAGSGETLEEIGKCVAYLDNGEAYAGGDTLILRMKNQNSLYFSYIMNSAIARKQINRLGQGHSVVHVYPKQLQGVLVPVPPKDEQDRIVNIIDELDRKMDVEKKKKLRLQRLKKGLMQKLLTGQIRVKVD